LIVFGPDCKGPVILRTCNGAVAEFGHDAQRGYWAETTYAGNLVTYDATQEDYDPERPLRGGLLFLGSYGFFGDGPVSDALRWADGHRLLEVPPGLRRVVRVIRRWREAAGE
jgi:hypothetical protein